MVIKMNEYEQMVGMSSSVQSRSIVLSERGSVGHIRQDCHRAEEVANQQQNKPTAKKKKRKQNLLTWPSTRKLRGKIFRKTQTSITSDGAEAADQSFELNN